MRHVFFSMIHLFMINVCMDGWWSAIITNKLQLDLNCDFHYCASILFVEAFRGSYKEWTGYKLKKQIFITVDGYSYGWLDISIYAGYGEGTPSCSFKF